MKPKTPVPSFFARIKKFFNRLFNLLFILACLALVGTAVTGAAYFGGQLPAKVEVKEIPVPIEMPERDVIEQIKEFAAIYGVPWQLAVAVHLHESGDGKWLYRYEPGKMQAAAKHSGFVEEQRMLASSHGPMHVLGLTALEYGVHWSKLYGSQGIELGVQYLAKGWEASKKLSKAERVNKTLLYYNGGGDPNYPGRVMAKLGQLLLSDIG